MRCKSAFGFKIKRVLLLYFVVRCIVLVGLRGMFTGIYISECKFNSTGDINIVFWKLKFGRIRSVFSL